MPENRVEVAPHQDISFYDNNSKLENSNGGSDQDSVEIIQRPKAPASKPMEAIEEVKTPADKTSAMPSGRTGDKKADHVTVPSSFGQTNQKSDLIEKVAQTQEQALIAAQEAVDFSKDAKGFRNHKGVEVETFELASPPRQEVLDAQLEELKRQTS